MKRSRSTTALSLALGFCLLSACSNNSSTATKSDSAAISDTAPHIRQEAFVVKTFQSQLTNPLVPPQQIPEKNRKAGEALYDAFPVLRDIHDLPVKGFLFDPKDFARTGQLKTKAVTYYFSIAVSNLDDSVAIRQHSKKPQYTIIVVPLDKDTNRIMDPTTKEYVSFDFTCPCPSTASCCPKQE